jgi:hypothetical protein
MKNKICPIMSRPQGIHNTNARDLDVHYPFDCGNMISCQESKCQMWVHGYTTEGMSISGCAFVFNAMKNQDGHYVV